MTLAESRRSTGEVSRRALMRGEAELFNRSYCEEICRVDLPAATGVRRAPERLRRTLTALARNLSTEVSPSRLAADVGGDGSPVDPRTIREYLDALTAVFALEELPPWSTDLRSRSRLRASKKIHLADPALACAALGVGRERLARDPRSFGLVFESMAVRDLRVYSGFEGARAHHYRDNTGLEVDAILEYPDGRWAAAEVKLGGSLVDAAEANLLKLRDERVDTERVGNPSFLAVITAGEFAYTRPSGVHVIPLGVLGP